MASNFDLGNLDVNNIGNWPIPFKGVVIIILCGLLLGGGYWYDTQEQLQQLEQKRVEEGSLREDFEKKQKKANVLPALKAQLEQINNTFGELLKRLPKRNEVDALLVDITTAGLATGAVFELFKPGAESPGPGGLYMELPISLTLVGNYHALAKFISNVASLPRIVTQHEISLSPRSDGIIVMTETAKIYRYVEEDEKK